MKKICKNNGAYTFLSRVPVTHSFIRHEKARHALLLTLEKKNMLFFSHYLRLYVQTSVGEACNFMPHYQNRNLNDPALHTEVLLQNRAIPFYQVPATEMATHFKQRKTQNLGALLFLSALLGFRLRDGNLYLVQSPSTKKFYFTLKLEPFDFHDLVYQDQSNFEEKMLRTIRNLFSNTHLNWWRESGLIINNKEPLDLNQIRYQEILFNDIFETVFRFSLIPLPFTELILNFIYMPQKSSCDASTRIRDRLYKFQREQQGANFQQMTESFDYKKLKIFYLDCLNDIRRFSLFPIGQLSRSVDYLDFQRIECIFLEYGRMIGSLNNMLFFSQKTLVDAFNQTIHIPAHIFSSVLHNQRHFFWEILNHYIQLIINSTFATDCIIDFDERLKCILIKSIEFKQLDITKAILFLFNIDLQNTLLTYRVEKSIAIKVGYPSWENLSLIDISRTVSNHAIENDLSICEPRVSVEHKAEDSPQLIENSFFSPEKSMEQSPPETGSIFCSCIMD